MSHNDEYFSPISYRTSPLFAPAQRKAGTDDPKYITFATKQKQHLFKYIFSVLKRITILSLYRFNFDMNSHFLLFQQLTHWPLASGQSMRETLTSEL